MNWLKRLWMRKRPSDVGGKPPDDDLALPGWSVVERRKEMTFWQDASGDVLSLTCNATFGLPDLSDQNVIRAHCRGIAEYARSGLVEADLVPSPHGHAVALVYKRLAKPAFVFTGMLVLRPISKRAVVWTIVARERGTTGVREAMVTQRLLSEGKLDLNRYEAAWAQDPYDPLYDRVDRSTLRYLSDDERYDPQFPEHPLSKVRRELRMLQGVELPPGGL